MVCIQCKMPSQIFSEKPTLDPSPKFLTSNPIVNKPCNALILDMGEIAALFRQQEVLGTCVLTRIIFFDITLECMTHTCT